MREPGIYTSILSSAEKAASGFFDVITDTFAGQAHSLRDGTEHEPVSLPRDLAAHAQAQTEWWYYTGHAKTDSGREFGFELVFFKRRTDLDRFSVVPVRLLGNPYYFAHFAITDKGENKFKYAHRKSANGQLDLPARASESHFYVSLGDWSVRLADETHILRATINSSVTFEASLIPQKPVVLNGKNGVSFKDHGEASRYFSYTRMSAEGDIILDGKLEHFVGSAWMDREFGTWASTENQKGWDWFSIQLDNGSELMIYQIRDAIGAPTRFSTGSYHSEDGSVITLAADDFIIEPLSEWQSPKSGTTYPNRWRISIPKLEAELDINPVLDDQELDTRGTTMIVYWEGACSVGGSVAGSPVTGGAYVELVGYDRSHERPDLSRFLLGNYVNYLGF